MCSRKRGRNSRQDTTSAKQIAENEDLLIEILKRLPAKSLVSSRRVCKHWRKLISSVEFHRTWSSTRRDIKPLGFLFCEYKYKYEYEKKSKFMYLNDEIPARTRSPYFGFPLDKVKIIQSCNGFILCAYTMLELIRECFVCNPTTKQVVKLNIPCRGAVFADTLGLAFDPRISPHYKVLCLGLRERVVYVYSSELRAWRFVKFTISTLRMTMQHQVYYKGVMYWMRDCPLEYGLRFDIENSKLENLRVPDTQEDNGNLGRSGFCHIGVCADRMYLVEWYCHNILCYIVHEMEPDGFGWVLKHRINFDQEVAPRLTMMPQELDFLCILEDENGELGMLLQVPGETVAYYLLSMIVKKIRLFPSYHCFKGFRHFETLYSV